MTFALPVFVETSLGPLLLALGKFGYVPGSCVASEEAFGNFRVVFQRGANALAITHDRGQYLLEGSREEMEAAGLWQAFASAELLSVPLVNWLSSKRA